MKCDLIREDIKPNSVQLGQVEGLQVGDLLEDCVVDIVLRYIHRLFLKTGCDCPTDAPNVPSLPPKIA